MSEPWSRRQARDVPEPVGPAAAGAYPPLRIQLLGGFRVTVGGRVVPDGAWRTQKARGLVKLLCLAPGHQLHREQLIDLLWPELAPEAGANNLRSTLHGARRALQPDRASDSTSPLHFRRDVLVLDAADGLSIDVVAFEAAAMAARRGQDPAAYEAALDRYTGDLLPEDRYEDWAAGPREALQEIYLDLLVTLSQIHESHGAYARAITTLERVVAADLAHEDAYVGLMRLYALSGRHGQALRQYARLREALARALDVEPSAMSRQLHAEIASGRFPPSGAARAAVPAPLGQPPRAHNLPAPLTSFIGRAREVADLAGLLAAGTAGPRLVTLSGAGGSGKSRLALEVGRSLVDEYRDGVWLVELAALADPALVPRAVAAAIGVREQPGRTLLDVLAEALHARPLLLVLDNCEHLIGACTRLVEALLTACPRLRILATSREALRVPGEATWRVPSLPLPTIPSSAVALSASAVERLAENEAVALFVDRVCWVRPGFVLAQQNAQAVARICHRLDGLPLALELAAARASVLAPEQLSTRLDDALRLLSGGTRTAPSRQQTLRATLDWSYDLLEAAERTLLRRLGVFAGGWTLGAAEVVCAGSSGQGVEGNDGIAGVEILDVLAHLVDKSLVQVEEGIADGAGSPDLRYRLLETVRQYAAEQLLTGGEADEMRERHAAYYLTLAEQVEPALAGPEQAAWLVRLALEYSNLRAALHWVAEYGDADTALRLGGALWRFWSVRGPVGEGRAWLSRLLARAGAAGDPAARAKALASIGLLAHQQGDYAAARPPFEECLVLRRGLGDRRGIVGALNNLAMVVGPLGDRARAVALLEESLALGREIGDAGYLLRTLNTLGEVAREDGEYERATTLYEESLALCRESGEQLGVAHLLHNLGYVALARDDPARAADFFRNSLHVCQELGDKGITYRCLAALGRTACTAGQSGRAARLFGAAQALSEAIGPLPPLPAHPHYEGDVAAVRRDLGDEAFAAAWAAGRALPWDMAIGEALAVADALTAAPDAASPAASSPTRLSRREREVAALLAQGQTNAQIAAALGIAERTADTHVSNLLRKLGFSSRAHVRSWASEHHLVLDDPSAAL